MKFLHAADIHLDSPLAGLARRGAVPAHVTRDCTRRAFVNLIDLAITEDVAFVLISGDVFDGDWRDFSTGLFFAEQMKRLARPCIILRGNHDAASLITRKLTLPPNVHEMSSRKVDRWVSHELGVVVHGRSFPERHIPEDFSETYPGAEPGLLSIAMLHTSGEDPGEHEVYAPCRIASLAGKGYDYWALGHIHARKILSRAPWIVFPGNIQGRHARETGAKGVMLVQAEDRRITELSFRATDVLRWASIEADLDGAETMADVALRLRLALLEQIAETEGRPILARVILRGVTDLHAQFAADPAAIEAECRNVALGTDIDIHIERVVLQTRTQNAGAGASADLAEAFEKGLDETETVQKLLAEFQKLRQDLPFIPGRGTVPVPQTVEELRHLVPEAWHLAARLLREGDAG
jgi:DNA repair exonuclease SbcCD nuclease subunit